MGEIMKIHCHTCQKEQECLTGCGLKHGRIGNVIAAFGAKEQMQILDWCESSPIPLYDFRYQIAVCDSCNHLVCIPVLRGIEDDAVFMGACPVCYKQLQTTPLEIEDITGTACPSCGSMTLTIEEVGHWD